MNNQCCISDKEPVNLPTMDEEHWNNVLKRMKYQLQGLAMPAEIQVQLFPDFVCKGDELAEDYCHWCLVVLGNDEGRLTEQQRMLLIGLDNYFDRIPIQSMGEPLWTDEGIKTRSEWEEIRVMATELLSAFGWPVEKPAEPI
ncbi:hypothetical protein B1R32_11411 [Abditibacterium utsteinense]|uniref:Uncharacterized protein n=1 Tax=Abditibacterium utsteinense TaxID=1960156 RepID=A0A2S8SQX7_9BACT|nr:hypothetical protein [Abditibacterium utsteinense]PQV63186.1 hypothetical protein B1R32_11411 [Abditibacterium utsteinense]